MFRIDADAHVSNRFAEADPGTGQPGTKVSADWLNAVQEELCNFLVDCGVTLNKAVSTQLRGLRTPVWTDLNVAAGYTAAGGDERFGYWKDLAGNVHLRGRIVSGAFGAQAFCTSLLPVGCRPKATRGFALAARNGSNPFIGLQVNSDGTLFFLLNPANDHIYLDGVCFPAEQ